MRWLLLISLPDVDGAAEAKPKAGLKGEGILSLDILRPSSDLHRILAFNLSLLLLIDKVLDGGLLGVSLCSRFL